MIFDLYNVTVWWFLLFFIGLIFLPFTSRLFLRFIDCGYIFSKIIGMALISYLIFILGLGHILSFSRLNSFLVLLIFGLLNVFILIKQKNKKETFKKWRWFFFEEILFLIGLIFWSRVRASQPDIHGLEKFMDFGFINSILRSEYFPPKDMWFTPFSINYYYFGHLTTAVLTKISGISSNISFNLMMATDFALCLVASFSLGINFMSPIFKNKKAKIIATGVLASLLVTFAGNLQTIYAFFGNYNSENPVPFWKLPFRPLSFPNSYWYPNATRFIYHTIHEFPIYSWVVADLHGHVLDIPFVLLTIAALYTLFKNLSKGLKNNLMYLIFSGFLLSVMYMTNAWDGIIYFLLILLILFFFFLKTKDVSSSVIKVGIVAFSLIVFVLPFNIFFKPFVSGIGILCSPEFLIKIGRIGPFLFEANHCQSSPFWQLAILYGFFYFFVFSFLILLIKTKKNYEEDFFVLFLIVLSTILIILPEFIYAKDIYPTYYRANTMFKMVYQSFIMLSLSSAYIIARIVSLFRENLSIKSGILKSIWVLVFLFLFSFVAIYPYFAINSYYNGLVNYSGLNGTSYLKSLYPQDWKAIQWLNDNIKDQPVILEAQGDSYSDYARISVNTGLPTVLGWTVHEWLWRGTYDIPAPRIKDVKDLYESSDPVLTNKLIKKYKISLVYIGDLERQKYQVKEEKFAKVGKLIFTSGNTKIYKINYSQL